MSKHEKHNSSEPQTGIRRYKIARRLVGRGGFVVLETQAPEQPTEHPQDPAATAKVEPIESPTDSPVEVSDEPNLDYYHDQN